MDVPVVSVIMAGGSGERFWPLSRQYFPKQLLSLVSEKPMLIEAVDLVLPLISPEQIWIATNAQLQDAVRGTLKNHPFINIIGEPLRRNTTGCLIYAAAHILAHHGDDALNSVMVITTADHFIADGRRFREVLEAVIHTANQNDVLVTIGIKPSRAETGYGYIDVTNQSTIKGLHQSQIYPVNRFVEKPNAVTVQEYISSGAYFWNSGMFFWKISTFLRELKAYLPQAADVIFQLRDVIKSNQNSDTLAEIFSSLPNMSIDYALMEKSHCVQMAVGDFGWDDIGAWDAVSRLQTVDERGNYTKGDPVILDCRNVTVINEPGAEYMAVGAVGLDNIVIVTTKDGVLVCHKDRAQDVKHIVEALKLQESKML